MRVGQWFTTGRSYSAVQRAAREYIKRTGTQARYTVRDIGDDQVKCWRTA